MNKPKTSRKNLEARFDAGAEVLDYFETAKAVRRSAGGRLQSPPGSVQNRFRPARILGPVGPPGTPHRNSHRENIAAWPQ